eukprot:NODE_5786_length_968_cov_40.500592_g5204_i0.p1 GENE.NODE_5786_length_968_cov_40.500592_g5204_i0~~NODE_5786_length_968_cov_40.500592_g5204_i0.p1  ORF type:complete len:292 (-),score=38.88 NODE_5786_length_968_cov_40.500592_g5204_i0:9-884(-)
MVCRERTGELHTIVAAYKAKVGKEIPHNDGPKKPPKENRTEFFTFAHQVTSELQSTSELLSKLGKLTKKRTVFEDHQDDIQEISLVIKQKLSMIHNDLQKLQQIKDQHKGWRESHADKHSTTVVNTLQKALMDTTKEFKDILQTRTTSLKETTLRRSNFAAEPPRLDSMLSATRAALASEESGEEGLSMLLVPQQGGQAYYQERSDAVRQVETTIVELSGMFSEFARIVEQQDELILRIDTDVETALANVEGAQNELLRYLNRISGNRWLILKVFGIIFFFIIFFGVFILK